MTACLFNTLPNELLLQIFAEIVDFDAAPPSTVYFDRIPSKRLTSAQDTPLKILSLVCHRWRALLLPTLFQFARINLTTKPRWVRLCTNLRRDLKRRCRQTGAGLKLITEIDELTEAASDNTGPHHHHQVLGFSYMSEIDPAISPEYLHWLPSLAGRSQNFLDFVRGHDLAGKIRSLVVYAHNELTENRSDLEENLIYQEVRSLWREIFRVLPVKEVVVAAPPSTMAALSGGYGREWDSWLFKMPYHYLRLGREHSSTTTSTETSPNPNNRAREIFLYNIRPWTHIAYNEGTFLRAYGHYEYQWMKPPCIFPSLLEWLGKDQSASQSPNIQDVEYISAFPYSSHVQDIASALARLRQVRILKVTLANPDLLEDKELMGKAQPSDIYFEWEACYRKFRTDFLSKADGATVFVPQDSKHATLRKQLVKYIQGDPRSAALEKIRWTHEEQGDLLVWTVH